MNWTDALIPVGSLLLGYALRYLAEYLQEERKEEREQARRRRLAQRELLVDLIDYVSDVEATTEAIIFPVIQEFNATKVWKGIDGHAEVTRTHMAVRRRTQALVKTIEDDEARDLGLRYLSEVLKLLEFEPGTPPDELRAGLKSASETRMNLFESYTTRVGDLLRTAY